MKIIADTHTHTVACDHAFSTMAENISAANEIGLKFLCMTEHAPAMPGGPCRIYFDSLINLPRIADGVMLIKGVELNILDYDGTVDLPEDLIQRLEWVIASYHTPCVKPADMASHTRCWMKIAENPLIHVIGHCGDPRYAFEHKPVLKAFKETGKIVEINAHSFHARGGSRENCKAIAILCAELGIPVVASSDAHYRQAVGAVEPALSMLEEIGFPEELIINVDLRRFLRAVKTACGKELVPEDMIQQWQ